MHLLHSRIRLPEVQRVALGFAVLPLLLGLFAVTEARAHSGKEPLGDPVQATESPGNQVQDKFLTGDADAIRRLTRPAGFRDAYDAKTDE